MRFKLQEDTPTDLYPLEKHLVGANVLNITNECVTSGIPNKVIEC